MSQISSCTSDTGVGCVLILCQISEVEWQFSSAWKKPQNDNLIKITNLKQHLILKHGLKSSKVIEKEQFVQYFCWVLYAILAFRLLFLTLNSITPMYSC